MVTGVQQIPVASAELLDQCRFWAAARDGNLEALRDYIEKFPDDLDCMDSEGYTALIHAITHKFERGVRLLIESGADVNTKNKDGLTALHYAAAWGRFDSAKLLLENGADRDAVTVNDTTAEDFAQRGRFKDVTELIKIWPNTPEHLQKMAIAAEAAAADIAVQEACVQLQKTQPYHAPKFKLKKSR